MFTPPYFGIDLDHCLNDLDFVDEFVETLQSYTEISRSGDGIHIICEGKLPEGNRRKNNVEMYSEGRYFIVTGNLYNENYRNIVDCTETVKILHSKYLPSNVPKAEIKRQPSITLDDSEIIDKARASKSGNLFTMLYAGQWEGLYSSQSEADLALCNQLAFWTGRNVEQMDRIFRSSGLYRSKWTQKRGISTYGDITINKACAACTDVYEPFHGNDGNIAFYKPGEINEDPGQNRMYDATDTGNAHRLYDKFGNILKYSYNRKKWYFWTGKVWALDESGEVKKLADEICEDLKREAWLMQDDDLQTAALKFAKRTANSNAKESMIKECQHLYDVPASPDDFDAYTDLINVQNGIVNLKNGELMPHDSRLMMSKLCDCEYDLEKAEPKRWLQFLDEVTAGNKELQEYLQMAVGYSISGSNKEQCVFFLYGMGNNGKSTFLDTISDMLGDYAANTQPDTIMMNSKFGNNANNDIARLKSARFVTCEEPTEGVRLNEGLLKQLTGGSKITCRFLYGESFEYTPEFKIWVATNHKPVIRGTDVGIWRRIKLIPFEVNIPKSQVDKNLKYKLRQEFPQIFAWAVNGYIKWQAKGFHEPDCVKEAVKDYKKEMDLLVSFLEQCIEIDYSVSNKDSIMAKDLFQLYMKWAKTNNEYEMTSNKFFREIGKKLPEKKRSGAGIVYPSIKITDYANSLLGMQYKFEDFN